MATDAKPDRKEGRRRVDVPGRYRRRGDRPQGTSSLVEALPARTSSIATARSVVDSPTRIRGFVPLAVILSIGVLGVDDRLKPIGLVVLPLLVITCKLMGLYDPATSWS